MPLVIKQKKVSIEGYNLENTGQENQETWDPDSVHGESAGVEPGSQWACPWECPTAQLCQCLRYCSQELRRGEEMVGLLLEEAPGSHPACLCPVPHLEGLPCPPFLYNQDGP